MESKISTLSLTLKKRCKKCLHVLREDGTCQNEKCKMYVPENNTEDDTNSENSVLFS